MNEEKLTAEAAGAPETKTYPSDAWYIVRGDRSGVFFGHIAERRGREVRMTEVRNLWYWAGAASIMQLALSGVKPGKEKNCNFTVQLEEIELTDAIQICPCTDAAVKSIQGVAPWTA